MDSGYDSDNDLISTEILENICDVSQSHLNNIRTEAHYKIRHHIRKIKLERKGAIKATRKWVKVYTRYLRLL